MAALAIPETLATEGERTGLPEENVVQVSCKYNEYQEKFCLESEVPW